MTFSESAKTDFAIPLRSLFINRFKELRGELVFAPEPSRAIREVLQRLTSQGNVPNRAVSWGVERFHLPPEPPPDWEIVALEDGNEPLLPIVERAQVGIGQCYRLIAETGSLVLFWDSFGEKLIRTLPDIFLCLAYNARLFTDLEEFLTASPPTRSFTIISGPSRTADIEKQLVIGAHGPGRVILLLDWEEIKDLSSNDLSSGL